MTSIEQEIQSNYEKFSVNWRKQLEKISTELKKNDKAYSNSYRSLVTIQAWRNHLETKISDESLAFFLEAQNDVLVSHVWANLGAWRSSLKSLRSSLENVLFCIYYKDHPIELRLWNKGKHKLGFSETVRYIEQHPELDKIDVNVTGIPTIKDEHSTLSKAVHGSATSFRMTENGTVTSLWSADRIKLGSWKTREKNVIINLNLLLLTIFRENLKGTREKNLRNVISLTIPKNQFSKIKSNLGINL